MKRLAGLTAALTWTAVLCAILAATDPRGAVVDGVPGTWILALVAALAVTLTLGAALSPLSSLASYVIAHLAGVAVVVAVAEGPRPPWTWHSLPGLDALFAHGTVSAGGTTTVLLAAALTWELSYTCTWLVLRERRPWLALSLIVGTLILASRPREHSAYLAALCSVGLALIAATMAFERRHTAFRGMLTRRLRSSLALCGAPVLLLPLAAALVAGAWAAPLPPSAIAQHGAGWTSALGYLVTHIGLDSGQAGDPTGGLAGFRSTLVVGGQFHPDDTPVLLATVAGPWRSPYWRGAVYDSYQNGVWRELPAQAQSEQANAALPIPSGVASGIAITQQIQLLQPAHILVTAGLPLRVGQSTVVSVARGGLAAGVLDLAPRHGALTGRYEALSLLPPSGSSSRAPVLSAALRRQDLTLPPLPARLKALARRLTAGSADPYSQAWAIQRYLHTAHGRYTYDTAPPQARRGQDPVDYFLFDSRRGFCTHFATTMVVLARLASIPARLVTGYAAGRFSHGQFTVTMADAHAWPELWIAGRGWITFEPTPYFPTPGQVGVVPPPPAVRTPRATRSATPRATARASASPRAGSATPTRAAGRASATPAVQHTAAPPGSHYGGGSPLDQIGDQIGRAIGRIPPPAALLALIVVLLIGGAVAIARARPDAVALYGRMSRLAGRLRGGPVPGQTPLEWATCVATRVPADGPAVMVLTTLYVRQRYGGHPPAPADLLAARRSWRAVRRRWIRRLLAGRRL